MKYAIIASKRDKAGLNIIENLKEMNCKIPIHLVEEGIVNTEGIDKTIEADFIIFASKHQSTAGGKTLSVHTIGNFKKADFGGKSETLSPASAQITKHFFQTLNKNNNLDYKVTLEATHHGPLLETPSLFIEIGSTEAEWTDKEPGKVVAKTIIESIESFKKTNNISAIGIGGPHYCPNFNTIQLNSKYALSFIVPKHGLPLTEDLVRQLKEKTLEKPNLAIVDYKGFNNADEKNQTLKLLEKNNLKVIKTREARGN